MKNPSKKFILLLSWLDFLYLVVILLLSQYLLTDEPTKIILSLPFFIIVPFNIGRLFLRVFSKYLHFQFELNSPVSFLFGSWCLGSCVMFMVGLTSSFLGSNSIFIFASLSLLLATFGKALRSQPSIIEFIKNRVNYVPKIAVFTFVALMSVLPLVFLYPHWSYPLKYDSDGFGINMVSLEFIKNGQLALTSSIHLPFESILLSVPSFIFGVAPYGYLWAAPLIIYPIFALAVFTIALKLSGNISLSIAASSVSVWFTGGTYTISDLFLALPRNLIVIVFLFWMSMWFENKNNFNDLIKQNLLNLSLIVFLFTVITFTLSPTVNHLSSYFLIFVLLLSLLSVMFLSRKLIKTRRLLAIFLVPCLIPIITFFMTGIDFPSLTNLNFFFSVIGIIALVAIIIVLARPDSIIKSTALTVVSILGLVIYHQVWLIVMLVFTVLLLVWSQVQKRAQSLRMIRCCLMFFFILIILLYSTGLQNSWSTQFSFLSLNGLSLINQVVSSSIMLLFFMGFLCAIFIGNSRELFAQLMVCALILLTLINQVNIGTARLLDFIFPFIAFFAVYPIFKLFSILWEKRVSSTIASFRIPIVKLNKKRVLTKIVSFRVDLTKTHNLLLIVVPVLCFLIIASPFLTFSATNFLNYNEANGLPIYTFNNAEYEVSTYIKDHFSSNVFIISDTFTTLLVTGLSGNSYAVSFRVPYDEKGNTHPLSGDANYLSSVRNFLQNINQSSASESLSSIKATIAKFSSLNERTGAINGGSNVTFLVVISGRTSVWLTQGSNKDVVYPQNMVMLPGYQKFFESSSYNFVYQINNEEFVFEVS